MLVRLTDEWFTFLPAGAIESIRGDLDLSYTEAGLVPTAQPAGGLLGHAFTVAAGYLDNRWLPALAVADSFLVLAVASFRSSSPQARRSLSLLPRSFSCRSCRSRGRRRLGQAGTTEAAVSTIDLFDIAVPPLAGRIADARGLSAGLSFYAAIALLAALLALIAAPLVRGGRATLPAAATSPENGADVGRAG